MSKGLLFVTMEPPPAMENEFNDWYDTEHLPERMTLPGVETGTRWVCIEGWPKYLALYDLTSASATETPEYTAVSGGNSSPWTKRNAAHAVGRQRIVATQVAPGGALLPPQSRISRLLLARYPQAPAGAADYLLAKTLPQLLQARTFMVKDSLWLVVAFSSPVSPQTVMDIYGTALETGANFFNIYVPYIKSEEQ